MIVVPGMVHIRSKHMILLLSGYDTYQVEDGKDDEDEGFERLTIH